MSQVKSGRSFPVHVQAHRSLSVQTQTPPLVFGQFLGQAYTTSGMATDSLRSMNEAVGFNRPDFSMAKFPQAVSYLFSNQVPHTVASTVLLGAQQTVEAAVIWGQQTQQLHNPTLLRSTMHPHLTSLQKAQTGVPTQASLGPAWSSFAQSMQQYTHAFSEALHSMHLPQGAQLSPDAMGFVEVLSGWTQAAQKLLTQQSVGTSTKLKQTSSPEIGGGGRLSVGAQQQHLSALYSKQMSDPLQNLLSLPLQTPSLPELQSQFQNTFATLQGLAGVTPNATFQQDIQTLLQSVAGMQPMPLPSIGAVGIGQVMTPEAALHVMHSVLSSFVQQLQSPPRTLQSTLPSAVVPSNGYIAHQAQTLFPIFAQQPVSALPMGQAAPQSTWVPLALNVEQVLAQQPMSPNGSAVDAFSSVHPGVTDPGVHMPSKQTLEIRKKIDKAIKDEDEDVMKKLAKDPKVMAAATSEQKAAMIREFVDGATKNSEDRAILDILESCTSKAEFDKVVELSGGKKVFDEIDLDEVKEKMSMLAGGWGRSELATNPVAASMMENELLKANSDLFVRGIPEDFDPSLTVPPDPNAPADERFRQINERRIKQKAYGNISPQTHKEILMENAKRRYHGRKIIDITELTARMEGIRAKKLSKKEREGEIESLRKEFGLSEDTMRELTTHRLGQIYSTSSHEAGFIAKHQLTQLAETYAQVVQLEGEDSPRAQALRKEIEQLKGAAKPYIEELGAVGEHLMELYPVPKDFWERFGDVVTQVMDVVGPLLNVIPGVGNILSAAYYGIKTVVAAVDGNWRGALGSLAGALGPLGKAIGGTASSILGTASKITKGALTAVDGVEALSNGDILGAIQSLGSAGLTGVGVAGASQSTLQTIRDSLQIAEGTARVGMGISNGQWDQALTGLGGLAGGLQKVGNPTDSGIRSLLSSVERGAKWGTRLMQGDWSGVLSEATAGFKSPAFLNNLHSIAKDPAVARIASLTQQGFDFVRSLQDGSLNRAMGSLSQTLAQIPGMQQSPHRSILEDALRYSRMGVNATQAIQTGQLGRAFDVLAKDMMPFFEHSDFRRGMQSIQHLSGAASALSKGEVTGLFRYFGQGRDGRLPLFEAFGQGHIRKDVDALIQGAQRVVADPNVQKAWGVLAQSSPWIQALAQGSVLRSVQQAQDAHRALQHNPSFQQSLGHIQRAESVLRAWVSGDLATDVAHTLQRDAVSGSLPFVKNMQPFIQDSSAFFGVLSSGLFTASPTSMPSALQRIVERAEPLRQAFAGLETYSQQLLEQTGNPLQIMRMLAQSGQPMLNRPAFAIRN